jgi:hypothetical protein
MDSASETPWDRKPTWKGDEGCVAAGSAGTGTSPRVRVVVVVSGEQGWRTRTWRVAADR